jgi:uncharacterized protein YcbK (DUF882 family)
VNKVWTRRRVMQAAVASGLSLAGARLAIAQGEAVSESPEAPERVVEVFNTHTRESARVAYWRGGDYDAAAMAKLRHVLRDHRNGASHDMEPALYDQLHDLAQAAGREASYEIISGYRSPESNAKLATAGSGVARQSLHMQGRAIDVRLRGFSTAALRDLALEAKKGGVGYYRRSDFVHLDTGRFRTWNG